MHALDGRSPEDFSGVDFATLVWAAPIYDKRKVEDQVAKVVADFFERRGLPTRRCGIYGLGAAAGGGPWMDVFLWVKENWESMQTMASAAIGFAIGVTARWKRLRRRLDNKALDPYKPSIVLELVVRAKSTDLSSTGESSRSFNSLLCLVPALHEELRNQLPDQKFSIRIVRHSEKDPSRLALFKVERITDADIARVLRRLKRIDHDPDSYAVLLYRQLGFITRLRRERGLPESSSLIVATNP